MKPKRGILKIIQTLALAGEPLTPYAIAKRSGLSKSLVHGYIKDSENGLEHNNIVKKRSQIPWRSGLKKADYILSFKGVVECLSLSLQAKRPEIKKMVKNFGCLYPNYPLFTEHGFLAQQLGDRIYDWYASIAKVVKARPGIALESAKKGEPVMVYGLSPRLPPEKEDEVLMHRYALVFLDTILAFVARERKPFLLNEVLCAFFEKTVAKEIEASRRELDRLEKMKAMFKKASEKCMGVHVHEAA